MKLCPQSLWQDVSLFDVGMLLLGSLLACIAQHGAANTWASPGSGSSAARHLSLLLPPQRQALQAVLRLAPHYLKSDGYALVIGARLHPSTVVPGSTLSYPASPAPRRVLSLGHPRPYNKAATISTGCSRARETATAPTPTPPAREELCPSSDWWRGIPGSKCSLRQFGYDLFTRAPTTFAPVTDVPVAPITSSDQGYA